MCKYVAVNQVNIITPFFVHIVGGKELPITEHKSFTTWQRT